jgi:Zn-dependent protease with chaperone function
VSVQQDAGLGCARLTARSGKVFVFTGILPLCKDENGIAAVLGHEIAHVVAHHTA